MATTRPSTPATAAAGFERRLDPALLKLAAILVIGGIAPYLDTTIVNVALATIGQSMHSSVSTIQWVVTGYLLTLAMAIPLSAWAVARFGGKRMWLLAMSLFLAGSVLSGAAWDVTSLIVFRVLQGVGAGLIQPIMLTLLVQAAGPQRLTRLITLVTLVAVLAPICGPIVGGLIINSASWRWIFYVNVPLCAVSLLWAWRGMPADVPREWRPLDVLGLALLSPALAAIIYGLSQTASHGGFTSSAVLIPLVAGIALLAAFIVHALHSRTEPIVDLRLFRVRSFSASASVLFLSGLSLYGVQLLLPLYYQHVRGQDALAAGLLLMPQGIGSLLSRWAGKLTDRIGARPIVLAGMSVATLGTLAYTQVGAHIDELVLAAALVVRGAGLGAATIAIITAAYQGVRPEEVPHASSATRILQQVGGSFGTAVLAVILQRELATHAAAGSAGQAAAFGATFWWSLGFTVLAVIPALFLPRPPRPANRAGRTANGTSVESGA